MPTTEVTSTPPAADALAADGGWQSRKFVAMLILCGLLSALTVLACHPKMREITQNLSTVVAGFTGIYAIFCGANAAVKFAAARRGAHPALPVAPGKAAKK